MLFHPRGPGPGSHRPAISIRDLTVGYEKERDGSELVALEISKANKLEVLPEYEATYPQEVDQISLDGAFDVTAMDKLVADEQALDLLPKGLDWRKWFDFDPLHAAQKAEGIAEAPTAAGVAHVTLATSDEPLRLLCFFGRGDLPGNLEELGEPLVSA